MVGKKEIEKRLAEAEQELRDIAREESKLKWLARTCKTCGEFDEEAGGHKGYLVDVKLVIADGEEGYSNIESYLCDECLIDFRDAMQKLNFVIHAHGGICFLEAEDCIGYTGDYKSCPIPELQYPE